MNAPTEPIIIVKIMDYHPVIFVFGCFSITIVSKILGAKRLASLTCKEAVGEISLETWYADAIHRCK